MGSSPSTARGWGSNVTTAVGKPAPRAVSITRRWPAWTPSNVPMATARSRRGSSSTRCATFTSSPVARCLFERCPVPGTRPVARRRGRSVAPPRVHEPLSRPQTCPVPGTRHDPDGHRGGATVLSHRKDRLRADQAVDGPRDGDELAAGERADETVSFSGNRATGTQRGRSVGCDLERRQERQRVRRRPHTRRIGVLDAERAYGGASQRPTVPAERVRDRAHVRPRADVRAQGGDAVLVPDELQRVNRRAAKRHLHRDTAPREPVRALAADLHRRRRRDPQFDLAAERSQPRLELVTRRRLVLLDDLALWIAGGRARPQVDRGLVALVEPDQVLHQPRRSAEQDEQEAARERVERPRVPRPRAGAIPDLADDRERRRARRLVDQHEPRRRVAVPPSAAPTSGRHLYAAAPAAAANSRQSDAVTSSTGASVEKPAACR